MTPAYTEIRARTLEIVDEQRIDAESERVKVVQAANDAVADYQRKAQLGETRRWGIPSPAGVLAFIAPPAPAVVGAG